MSLIDVTDEGLVGAPPEVVFQAVLEFMAGKSSWWTPHVVVRADEEAVPGQVGSRAELRIPRRARFSARIEQVEPPSLLRVSYPAGDFRGDGLWIFEPEGTATRVRFTWRVTPARWWLRAIAPLVQRIHSQVMTRGFAALDRHLRAQRATRTAA